MKYESFAAGIAVLAASFGRAIEKPLLEGYWLALSELTDAQFAAACRRALEGARFFPAAAELRAFAGIISLSDRGPEAWLIVRAALDQYDHTDSLDFGPLVNAVVRDLGGWQYLCACSIPDLVWREKEFVAKFRARANRPIDPGRGLPLRGSLSAATLRQVEAPGSDSPRALPSRESGAVTDTVRGLARAKS